MNALGDKKKQEKHCDKAQETHEKHRENNQEEHQRRDIFKEFQTVGKNFEDTIRRAGRNNGEEAIPPIEMHLMGPLILKTVQQGDWVYLTANISWSADADNTRMTFVITRDTYDGQEIASVADAQSQGEQATTPVIGVDMHPLLNGRPPIYFVKALLYFGDATIPATSAHTGDISQMAINIPNLTFTGIVIEKNIPPYPNNTTPFQLPF